MGGSFSNFDYPVSKKFGSYPVPTKTGYPTPEQGYWFRFQIENGHPVNKNPVSNSTTNNPINHHQIIQNYFVLLCQNLSKNRNKTSLAVSFG